MTVEIGPLLDADAPRCHELERVLFPDESPWPVSAFVDEINTSHNHYFAAREDGVLLGYAGVSLLAGTHPNAEVHNIGVDPAAQGRGIGRLLLTALLELADANGGPTFLDVRFGNDPAIGLYESSGFVKIGLRKKYYMPSGADAVVMMRGEIVENPPVEDPS